MNITLRHPGFVVLDDVLSHEDLTQLWEFARDERYKTMASGDWRRAWRLNDGTPYVSRSYFRSQGPLCAPLEILAARIERVAEEYPDIVGNRDEIWDDIGMQIFLYRRGERISWHQDTRYSEGQMAGSAVFYLHREWSSLWGGELMLADPDDVTEEDEGGAAAPLLDGREERALIRPAVGTYVVARPNRLVLISARTLHSTARVDPDAGDRVRCSVSAFFGRRRAFAGVTGASGAE
jgi:Rps23 Pro-64 3,4-dihydroxylase Tpa1-like proline 4-hydroxylase